VPGYDIRDAAMISLISLPQQQRFDARQFGFESVKEMEVQASRR